MIVVHDHAMRAKDLSPALIGQRIRVQGDGLDVTGVLQDLGVTVSYLLYRPCLEGVEITLSDHELRLTGNESCTVVHTPQGGQS